MIKFFRIPKVFNYRYPFFSKSSLRVQAVPVFCLSCIISCSSFICSAMFYLTSNGVQQSIQRWTYGFLLLLSELGVVCEDSGQTIQSCHVYGEQYKSCLLHPATEHYHPHNHQGQRVASQRQFANHLNILIHKKILCQTIITIAY